MLTAKQRELLHFIDARLKQDGRVRDTAASFLEPLESGLSLAGASGILYLDWHTEGSHFIGHGNSGRMTGGFMAVGMTIRQPSPVRARHLSDSR